MKKIFLSILIFGFFSPLLTTLAQEVDLLWQGETYTPPFYLGRSLWAKQSEITFLAVPIGLGNPQALAYRWLRNGTVLGSLSGTGKNSLTLTDSVLSKPQTIKVEVLRYDDYEEPVLASKSITLTPVTPSLTVYENNPLYGFLFDNEISGTYLLKEAEVTFGAFPFFFSASDHGQSNLNYKWQTNTGGVETRESVTYRAPEDAAGSASINLTLTRPDKILQSAQSNFLIQFGDEE